MEIQDEVFDAELMGRQLKKLRNASKLSQERFAERLGMSRDTIYNYEKGKTAIPHDLIKRLCQEFNVSADYFYFNIDKPLIEPINILDSFDRTLQECTDFEKQQLMDDAYCRDISIKIRSHLDVKRKNGEYIGAFVPYGYEKSEDDKHKLVIDTYAAGVVKEIFRLKLHGMSQETIATQLNDEGVLAPMEYKQSTGSGYQTGFLQNDKSVWSSVTVRRILENEIYIGNLVQGKRTTPNHKVKQEVVKPEADWIRIEKNHEPIISDRDFEIVQRLLGMDTRISPDSDVVYNLSGIAVCADCGAPMTRKITTAGGKKYAYYICSNHKMTKQCSQHSISVSLLEDTVLEMLKLHIKNVMNLEEILDYIGEIPFQQLDVKNLEARKQKKLEEVEKCKRLKTSLYEDMKDGILTKEEYLELHEAYLKKAKEGGEMIRQIEREIALILDEKDDKHIWMNYFTEYKDIKELTRDVVVKLISEVRVSENKEIEIVFDFDDCYKQLLESVEKLGYQVDKEPDGQLNISRREAV